MDNVQSAKRSQGRVGSTDSQCLHRDILDHYQNLESRMAIDAKSSSVSYTSPVNFTESMSRPRHRWFPYKEGFSPSFVSNFLDSHLNMGEVVLDPFGGVGTTALAAAEQGASAISLDVSPLTTFIATVKATNLSKHELLKLREEINRFSKARLRLSAAPPDNETVIRYFEPKALEALLRVKMYITQIEKASIRDLFFLAFLTLIESYSTHRKAGNGVKKKTRVTYSAGKNGFISQVKTSMLTMLEQYQQDLHEFPIKVSPTICRASCLEDDSLQSLGDIGVVLTSPPYANCFDYSKIYMRELWLGDFFHTIEDQRHFRRESVRSHVHATWDSRNGEYGNLLVERHIASALEEQKLWSNKIPSMLSGYFQDIGKLLHLLKPRLSKNATLGFVVSNSFYGGIPIATDLLIAETAEQLGYRTKSIDIYRGMIPSSQQYNRIEDKYFMRESLVVLES